MATRPVPKAIAEAIRNRKRASGLSVRALAVEFGIGKTAVSEILKAAPKRERPARVPIPAPPAAAEGDLTHDQITAATRADLLQWSREAKASADRADSEGNFIAQGQLLARAAALRLEADAKLPPPPPIPPDEDPLNLQLREEWRAAIEAGVSDAEKDPGVRSAIRAKLDYLDTQASTPEAAE